MMYVEVIFNLQIEKSFTYRVPPEFSPDISIGKRVLAPFGRRELTGIVVKMLDSDQGIECKDVIDILDDKALISQELLELTHWMAEYYMCGWGQTLNLTLPKGLDKKSDIFVNTVESSESDLAELTENQRHLYDLIAMDPGKTTASYKKKFGTGSFDYSIRLLEKKRFITLNKHLVSGRVRKKIIRYLTIPNVFEQNLSAIRKSDDLTKILLPMKGKTLAYLDFREQTGLLPGRIKTLLSQGVLEGSEGEIYRTYETVYKEKKSKITLNKEQRKSLEQIYSALRNEQFGVFLLHGVTGSGKTQVYLEAIRFAIAKKKSAIVLIPEITLTPQTVGRFNNFFPGLIYIFHSRMSLGERYDTWRKVAESETSIVIGPRSSLFLPVKNLGIIVVDEEHDGSYKQESPAPRYHARDTAIFRARLNNASVILGSATPSMESTYNAQRGKYKKLTLEKRVANLEMPVVHVVSLQKSNGQERKSHIFSSLLYEKIQDRLDKREQIILLQNRRGFSSFMQCEDCGYTSKCPHCDIYLTFHTSTNQLLCHYCGYNTLSISNCPKCSGIQIKYMGAGTEQIEQDLTRLFKGVRVLRMDIDTTSVKGAHDRILHSFKEGHADILLGTQMISKGLDFENVSLVGVISADIGITLPDFRTGERVFQLLTQVAGRSGRKKKRGEVVIQTGMKNHYAIKYARRHDYHGFYHAERDYREESNYPPFSKIIKIGITAADKRIASQSAQKITALLRKRKQIWFAVIGPAPSPVARIKNNYRWQILLKINLIKDPTGKQTRKFVRNSVGRQLYIRKKGFGVMVDVDPIEMM